MLSLGKLYETINAVDARLTQSASHSVPYFTGEIANLKNRVLALENRKFISPDDLDVDMLNREIININTNLNHLEGLHLKPSSPVEPPAPVPVPAPPVESDQPPDLASLSHRMDDLVGDYTCDGAMMNQNVVSMKDVLQSQLAEFNSRLYDVEKSVGVSSDSKKDLDLSDLQLHLPDPGPNVPPQLESIHRLNARISGLEGLFQRLQTSVLDVKSRLDTMGSSQESESSSDTDRTFNQDVLHRLDALEWQGVHHTANLTKLDNEYVALASEVKKLQEDKTTAVSLPSTGSDDSHHSDLSQALNANFTMSKLALLDRKIDQLNVIVGQLQAVPDDPKESVYVTKSWVSQALEDLPKDVVTLDNLSQVLDGRVINAVADVITARMGGKARLAASLMQATSHVKAAAAEGISTVLGQVMDDLVKLDGDVFKFEGDARAQFVALMRFYGNKLLWLTDTDGDSEPVDTGHSATADSPVPSSEGGSRIKRQVPPGALPPEMELIRDLLDLYGSYDNYWIPHLKYLDTERVHNYLTPGGVLDSWLGLIYDMSDKLDGIVSDSKRPKIDVSYNMELRQDVPRFLGQQKPKIGKRF